MGRLLLLSNGHGEDLSGALLGQALQYEGHAVDALPLVGKGQPYRDAGIALIGGTQEFSTGGLGYTSLRGRLTELLQGQVVYLLRRLLRLLRIAHRYDQVVVIGDVIPVMAAWLCRRPVATYLVAYSSHYEGKLRLPWPCAECLRSPRFQAVFSRDQLSADDLSAQLRKPVRFLGNPFMDPILRDDRRLPNASRRLGLLPGSRRPELEENLVLLLGVVEHLPAALLSNGELQLELALVSSLADAALSELVAPIGWSLKTADSGATTLVREDAHRVQIRRGGFGAVLHSSDLLLCMAGTAAEQAVGLARPVLQLVGEGPQFTAGFAEAQRRLLGPTVFCVDGEAGTATTLQRTAALALELLERSHLDQQLQRLCQDVALNRLGEAGGGARMAASISQLLRASE
ncbi:lipid-A-disaccharide synthase-related protein [Synechococcus sp. UW179A]|uniref:lipid-A-disaccharide synthase-related protein n=1 Tax=Synechococcus sp. UW179A TaxID=2575510 RepID=UPI000E0E349B|nr:lipid-A-disaccharide synthase-related protein [Synechococcus sp. UW179A]